MNTIRKWFGEIQPESIMFFKDERDWSNSPPVGYELETLYRWTDPEIQHLLDDEFDDGYGGPESHNFVAWGVQYVYFPDQYDGAECLCKMPRNPDFTYGFTFSRPGG